MSREDGSEGTFRWDLLSADHLGTLIADLPEPDLWYLDDLVTCTGRILARSADGDLVFVGRSLDSAFDLLSGALAETSAYGRTARLDLSLRGDYVRRNGRWVSAPHTPAQSRHLHSLLAGVGVTPQALARRSRPLVFVDVVAEGSTFGALFTIIRDWVSAEGAQWDVIRRKLRFLGVTIRTKNSPNAYRWQQSDAPWASELPRSAIRNVSLDGFVWSHLADNQDKLTRSHHSGRWLAGPEGPRRDERTRAALAEAVAIVAYGRSPQGRRALARATAGEPGLRESWLRSLVTELHR